jgi:hypothetical protein
VRASRARAALARFKKVARAGVVATKNLSEGLR